MALVACFKFSFLLDITKQKKLLQKRKRKISRAELAVAWRWWHAFNTFVFSTHHRNLVQEQFFLFVCPPSICLGNHQA